MVVPSSTRSTRAKLTHEAVVNAAAELFARRGYRATSLDDIGGALEVRKASLYHYINSKEELLTSIYDRVLDRIHGAVAPLAASDLPPAERLRRMIFAHVDVVANECDMLTVLFREEAELGATQRSAIRRRKREHQRLFEDVIDEGIEAGALRPLTTQLMVFALLGMCNWMVQWYRPSAYSSAEVASELVLILESGLLAGDDRRGAWPRPTSVKDALAPVRAAARRTAAQLDELTTELDRAESRLGDGLIES